jgi:MFS family permease
MLSPVILAGLTATLTVSQLYGRVPAHFLLIAAIVFFCIGNILIATMPANQTYWAQTFISTLVTPFGMDISFPAASLIVSNTMPIHQQGVAASMVNTAINWSISLGLGIAGTVESELLKRGRSSLEGYRGALYVGIGLSGAGVLVALLFCRVPPATPAMNVQKKQSELNAVQGTASDTIIGIDAAKREGLEGEFPTVHRF